MSPTVIAGLVKAQAPDHASCRAQDFTSYDTNTRVVVVHCSCNVDLSLTVPAPVSDKAPKAAPAKGVGDGS